MPPASWLIAFVAFLLVVHLLRTGARRRRFSRQRPGRLVQVDRPASNGSYDAADQAAHVELPESGGSYDAADQLRTVMNASFRKRRLMSPAEFRVFQWAEQAIRAEKRPWRVMAQVSLGEILASPDEAAYRAINSKRVDVLVIAKNGDPVVALEFQGDGHWQGTASARDAVKKEALRRAGIGYIEVTPQERAEDVARELGRVASGLRAPAGRAAEAVQARVS